MMCDIDWKKYYEAEESAGIRDHPKEELRFKATFGLLRQEFESVLDVGCGEGYWLEYMSKRVPKVEGAGIELAANRAERARNRLPHFNIIQGSATELPFPDNSFDLVTCLEVLEHVPDWHAVMKELIRVSRKTVLVTVPYRQAVSYEICVHCHKQTPKAGHLHSFDEKSFADLLTKYPLRFRPIVLLWSNDLVRRLYYRLSRLYTWLAVAIEV